MKVQWDGVTRSGTVKPELVAARHALADAARDFNWPRVFELLDGDFNHVNAWRLDGKSWYTPLHQAAYGNAPADVVDRLIQLGAWRTLRNADGQRPVDVARKRNQVALLERLEPVYKHQVPPAVLIQIQANFHATILGRASNIVDQEKLRLPELVVMLELDEPAMWFPVPGMYGGFDFRLEPRGEDTILVAESWSRVVGGSGQRHQISARGTVLVEEGFV
jgi:hypothetical protein